MARRNAAKYQKATVQATNNYSDSSEPNETLKYRPGYQAGPVNLNVRDHLDILESNFELIQTSPNNYFSSFLKNS